MCYVCLCVFAYVFVCVFVYVCLLVFVCVCLTMRKRKKFRNMKKQIFKVNQRQARTSG